MEKVGVTFNFSLDFYIKDAIDPSQTYENLEGLTVTISAERGTIQNTRHLYPNPPLDHERYAHFFHTYTAPESPVMDDEGNLIDDIITYQVCDDDRCATETLTVKFYKSFYPDHFNSK